MMNCKNYEPEYKTCTSCVRHPGCSCSVECLGRALTEYLYLRWQPKQPEPTREECGPPTCSRCGGASHLGYKDKDGSIVDLCGRHAIAHIEKLEAERDALDVGLTKGWAATYNHSVEKDERIEDLEARFAERSAALYRMQDMYADLSNQLAAAETTLKRSVELPFVYRVGHAARDKWLGKLRDGGHWDLAAVIEDKQDKETS